MRAGTRGRRPRRRPGGCRPAPPFHPGPLGAVAYRQGESLHVARRVVGPRPRVARVWVPAVRAGRLERGRPLAQRRHRPRAGRRRPALPAVRPRRRPLRRRSRPALVAPRRPARGHDRPRRLPAPPGRHAAQDPAGPLERRRVQPARDADRRRRSGPDEHAGALGGRPRQRQADAALPLADHPRRHAGARPLDARRALGALLDGQRGLRVDRRGRAAAPGRAGRRRAGDPARGERPERAAVRRPLRAGARARRFRVRPLRERAQVARALHRRLVDARST